MHLSFSFVFLETLWRNKKPGFELHTVNRLGPFNNPLLILSPIAISYLLPCLTPGLIVLRKRTITKWKGTFEWCRSRQILVLSRHLFLLSWSPFNVYFIALINSEASASRLPPMLRCTCFYAIWAPSDLGVVMTEDHRDKIEVSDPLVVEGLISYNLVSVYLRKLRKDQIVDDVTFYKVLPSGSSSGVLYYLYCRVATNRPRPHHAFQAKKRTL